ncbi:hypothetical protein [Curtobacterium sp. MCPF17_052]|uniref:hypothetical protein n=1 Tax=Curtobacterium sp. MCPF17_052 TaxID=2175655 RepID=UPI0024DF43ED|nr:hypothetical protein [Curtobacterium sp. MCPF17_052]WIB14072.1 hypothetical protein DEJ36_17070 [Curtobacterium sp. MCPF17_052]
MPEQLDGAPMRRRQWGAERRTQPLDTIHARPSDRKLVSGRVAIILTIAFWLAYVVYTVIRQFLDSGTESFRFTTEAISYTVVVTFLTFSALMHLVARQGALERFATHVRVPRAELDRHFAEGHESPLTVLVPSYAEEPEVVATTLWSAALQEYPNLRIVLLVDDSPFPNDPETAAKLERTRAVADTIQAQLAAPSRRFQEALLSAEIEAAGRPARLRGGRAHPGRAPPLGRRLAPPPRPRARCRRPRRPLLHRPGPRRPGGRVPPDGRGARRRDHRRRGRRVHRRDLGARG